MRELTDILPVILVALLLWLSGLSYVFWRMLSHYRRIAGKAQSGDVISALETVLKSEEVNSKEIKRLASELESVTKNQVVPIQKVGLVRFNPFNETGGDQSFSLCLLNGEGEGFILTTLHTRDRTRVYTKPVIGWKSKYELSREEENALKEAKK